jgi:hypothetical protein
MQKMRVKMRNLPSWDPNARRGSTKDDAGPARALKDCVWSKAADTERAVTQRRAKGFWDGAKEISMLLTLFVILLVMWLLGFFAFHVAGGLIHILLLVAVIALVVHLFRGRRVA